MVNQCYSDVCVRIKQLDKLNFWPTGVISRINVSVTLQLTGDYRPYKSQGITKVITIHPEGNMNVQISWKSIQKFSRPKKQKKQWC